MIARYLGVILVIAVSVAIAVGMKEPLRGPGGDSGHAKHLKFSHSMHIKDQGIGCEDCHVAAKTSKSSADSLVPGHAVCQTCHEEKVASECAFCHADAENIQPLHRPERTIIFSHEKHLSVASVKCETCHGGLDSVEYAGASNFPTMNTCTSCHGERQVSLECATCHSDLAGMIPKDHLAGDFRKDHKQLTRLGSFQVSCATCHTESFCQDCHTGIELQRFTTGRELMADPSPRVPLRDSPRALKLQNVHGLNYRFTHGIDAKSKAVDCASCHEEETFCVTCHESGGNITQLKFKPATHTQPGFTTLGRGSGGGRHAELAKRDLESCMSCHDVRGSDPVCFTCHTEQGGVR